MSYMGFTEIMTQYCEHLNVPSVLEIGIDRGQTSLPLLHNLVNITGGTFFYVGIDIRPDSTFTNQVLQMRDLRPVFIQQDKREEIAKSFDAIEEKKFPANTVIIWGNSLDVLPVLKSKKLKFDLVLIDGDHNYDTVSQELSFLKDITYPASLVVCDDYNSERHSNKDSSYISRESHSGVLDKFTDLDLGSAKGVGANQAIDHWIKDNESEGWACRFIPDLEPAILTPGALSYSIEGLQALSRAQASYRVGEPGIFRFKAENAVEAEAPQVFIETLGEE
jgi:hypothetical protein